MWRRTQSGLRKKARSQRFGRVSNTTLREIIAKYHEGGAHEIAEVYAFRNQSDEAFEWLDRAHARPDSGPTLTKVDALPKSLRHDPRYTELLKKLNLPT